MGEIVQTMSAKERILAVGDLHGMHEVLTRLITELLPTLGDDIRLVFMGDYIDRGPNSAQVVAELIKLKRARPDTVFLMGNHEAMLLDALEGIKNEAFLLNGGQETLRSYGLEAGDLSKLPEDHVEFIRGLEPIFLTEENIFVHAGLRPGVDLQRQDPWDLVWIREEFYLSGVDFGRKVIFGHTPFHKPLVTDHAIGIDTGAVFGNSLTCLQLPEVKFHSLDTHHERR